MPEPKRPAYRNPPETKIYGINACLALFRARPEAIVRGYFGQGVVRRFADVMRYLAAQRLAYHVVPDEELELITESVHHEGVCLLVRRRPVAAHGPWLRRHAHTPRACVLALEGIGNPHNLGAILRVAAHFGVAAVLVPDPKAFESGAAARTAEGGFEAVELLGCERFDQAVKDFRAAGFTVLGTSSHAGGSLFETALPPRALILFGGESRGLSPAMLAAGELTVRIPGTGAVESLNVGTAVGIVLGEYWHQHRGR